MMYKQRKMWKCFNKQMLLVYIVDLLDKYNLKTLRQCYRSTQGHIAKERISRRVELLFSIL